MFDDGICPVAHAQIILQQGVDSLQVRLGKRYSLRNLPAGYKSLFDIPADSLQQLLGMLADMGMDIVSFYIAEEKRSVKEVEYVVADYEVSDSTIRSGGGMLLHLGRYVEDGAHLFDMYINVTYGIAPTRCHYRTITLRLKNHDPSFRNISIGNVKATFSPLYTVKDKRLDGKMHHEVEFNMDIRG